MNTSFKRVTTALATSATLLSSFFAHNVHAAPSDAVCVAMGKLGGVIVDVKKDGLSEKEAIDLQNNIKGKKWRERVVKMVKYIYVDDGAYVDARYLYLKCSAGHFD